MKRFLFRILLPWLVTIVALYFAFRDVEWTLLFQHIGEADPVYLAAAMVLTISSYVLRAMRWPLLFPKPNLSLINSYRVLVLGFFMNNVLPARAGELVRAHLGAKVVGETRTLVLATVASERLADGVTISLLFAVTMSLTGAHGLDPQYARNLLYVSYLFGFAALGLMALLTMQHRVFAAAESIERRFETKASAYTLDRFKTFVEGLRPLCNLARLPRITFWSAVIWTVELLVFVAVTHAFGSPLSLSGCVLFMVAVNFSSLVPAAPGGFGVIELVAKKVLLSIGVASDELALSMVLTQHVLQYLIVGIPGAVIMATWRSKLRELELERELEGSALERG